MGPLYRHVPSDPRRAWSRTDRISLAPQCTRAPQSCASGRGVSTASVTVLAISQRLACSDVGECYIRLSPTAASGERVARGYPAWRRHEFWISTGGCGGRPTAGAGFAEYARPRTGTITGADHPGDGDGRGTRAGHGRAGIGAR